MFNTPTSGPSGSPDCSNTLRVLVADDDPASRLFLVEAMRTLGLSAEACNDGPSAIARGREETFDLLLLDCRMPGAGAEEVLSELRADPQAHSGESTAVATSADMDAAQRQQLISSGFTDVLQKPCDLADLRRIVSLVHPLISTQPVLDDSQGLASTGNPQILQAMRSLLRDELVALYQELDSLRPESPAFADRLHRLRASCGFCGAVALAERVVQVRDCLASCGRVPEDVLGRFRQTLISTIEALDPHVTVA